MRPEERDRAYFWDMREFAKDARDLLRGVSFPQLEKDKTTRLALERSLELLGEAARRVSAAARRSHPAIDWKAIIGQRNILAHDYGEVDHRRLYESARERIPSLIAELDRMLRED